MTEPTAPSPEDDDSAPAPSGAPRALRWLGLALLAAVILVVLFTTVFPWIERYVSNPSIGG